MMTKAKEMKTVNTVFPGSTVATTLCNLEEKSLSLYRVEASLMKWRNTHMHGNGTVFVTILRKRGHCVVLISTRNVVYFYCYFLARMDNRISIMKCRNEMKRMGMDYILY